VGWSNLQLNASSAGTIAVTVASTTSDTLISGFNTALDSVNMVVGTGWAASYHIQGGVDFAAITDPTNTYGVVFSGMTPDQFSAHVSTASVGGAEHLYVS
jgi:hypothetical protein